MKKIVIMYCLQFIARYGLVKIRMEEFTFYIFVWICLQDWSYCSRVLGKYGHDSLLNTIYRVNIRTIPVHTALAAREMIKNMSLEGILKINLACGALFTWVCQFIG